jgi:hypothetical protein
LTLRRLQAEHESHRDRLLSELEGRHRFLASTTRH